VKKIKARIVKSIEVLKFNLKVERLAFLGNQIYLFKRSSLRRSIHTMD
jgi:hypothetical protein